MKKNLILMTIISMKMMNCYSQVQLPEPTSISSPSMAPNPKAMLDVSSTEKGILIPRMSKTERENILPLSSIPDGLMVYQTDNVKGFYYFNATVSTWQQVGASASPWMDYAMITDKQVGGTPAYNSSPKILKWNLRYFTNIVKPATSGISLSSTNDFITIPAGTYYIKASVPGYHCKRTKIVLTTASDTSTVNSSNIILTGTSEQSYWSTAWNTSGEPETSDAVSIRTIAEGFVTVTSSTAFRVFQWFEAAHNINNNKNGWGVTTNASWHGAIDEIYSQILIQRIN